MGQAPEDIERHIYETRARLDENVAELRARVRAGLDWRNQMQLHPYAATGAAFGVGLLLSLLLVSARTASRRRASRQRVLAEIASGRRDLASGSRKASWNDVVDTLIAMGPEQARTLFGQLLPALQQYVARR